MGLRMEELSSCADSSMRTYGTMGRTEGQGNRGG
jgi:hypothetical protein